MCGIAGIVVGKGSDSSIDPNNIVSEMIAMISHRGPDGAGLVSRKNTVLGHARLSIVDISGGVQPMCFNDDTSLVFNGEIYNSHELRCELESVGVKFLTSHSDTEVIYQGFIKFGYRFFKKLRGMYALAILDGNTDELYLARDSRGIKPLYIYECNGVFAFGSEPKVFKSIGVGLKNNITVDGLSKYLKHRVVVGPATFFQGVKKILPGQVIKLNIRTMEQTEVEPFALEKAGKVYPTDFNSAIDGVDRVLKDAVRSHLVSDVKVGLFLSGGVDSSIIAAIAAQMGVKDAYTIATKSGLDESRYAKMVAKKFNLNLKILTLDDQDFLSGLQRWSFLNDDPVADPSALALLMLSDFAAKDGTKVVLAGDGADELFGGYNAYTRFFVLKSMLRFLPKSLLSVFFGSDPRSLDYLKQSGNIRFMGSAHSSSDQLTSSLIKNVDLSNDYLEKLFLYTRQFTVSDKNDDLMVDQVIRLGDDILPRTDRATMGASLECRVPFLDEAVVAFANGLSPKYKTGYFGLKRKDILKRYALELGVPKQCIYRSKLGFELPLNEWLRGSLKVLVVKYLNKKSLSLFDYDEVKALYENLENNKLATSAIWHWLTLELWNESHCSESGEGS